MEFPGVSEIGADNPAIRWLPANDPARYQNFVISIFYKFEVVELKAPPVVLHNGRKRNIVPLIKICSASNFSPVKGFSKQPDMSRAGTYVL